MKITPGMNAKTVYGTPVEIIREAKPWKCDGKENLQRVDVVFYGWHSGGREITMLVKNLVMDK